MKHALERKRPRADILLAMEWVELGEARRRLTETYRDKWDDELRALAADFSDLTDTAQQVLREEMMRRGLGDPAAVLQQGAPATPAKAQTSGIVDFHPAPENMPLEDEHEDEESAEFTWKTPLCDCETNEHAWQIGEMLRRAGIDSWIEAPRSNDIGLNGPRVVVAADQLDQARLIAAQPIPQEVVDQSKAELAAPEPFEAPLCPECGAPDPVLMEVDPVNSWHCEACGHEWTDPDATQSSPAAE